MLCQLQIGLHHDLHQFLELHLRLPAQLFAGLGRISNEEFHFGRALIAGVVFDILLPVELQCAERLLHEFLHAVRLIRCHHIVIRLVLLEHHPHHFHVVLRVAPVTLRIHVPQEELVLQAHFDARGRTRDLARHKGLATAWRFVVEQNPAARMQAVALAVVHRQPVAVHLGAGVG